MAIEYQIHDDLRLVTAAAHESLIDEEVFSYQKQVWSRPEVQGYGQLFDMTDVAEVILPPPERLRYLANLGAAMDAPTRPSRFAIIAPMPWAFDLARVFAAYRESNPLSTKEIRVFRSRSEAEGWLGLSSHFEREARNGLR